MVAVKGKWDGGLLAPPKPRVERVNVRQTGYSNSALNRQNARLGCHSCPLDKERLKSPKMEPTGAEHPVVYVLGEAPGKDEDEKGEQFVGKSGQLLRKELPTNVKIRFNNTIRCFVSSKVVVHTAKGQQMIKDVQVGDLVLTHTGHFRKVLSRLHDLPPSKRTYDGPLFEVRIKYTARKGYAKQKSVKQTVILGHEYQLSDGSWIKVENLRNGARLRVLATECRLCGKLYFVHHSHGDNFRCSPECHRHTDAVKELLSSIVSQQYRLGVRDKIATTAAANKATRKLVANGQHNLQHVTPDQIWKAKIKRVPKTFGKNEIVIRDSLRSAGFDISTQIDFLDEKHHKVYWADLGLRKEKILIEIDGQSHHNKPVRIRDRRLHRLAWKKGWRVLRFDCETPTSDVIAALSRVLANDKGQYKFVDAEITVRRYQSKRPTPLYCLEVEKDHSFLVNNVVTHNCRPPGNREPSPLELACCRSKQEDDIAKTKPKLILGFGNVPLKWMTRLENARITAWRGRLFPIIIKDHACWFMPILHPAAVLRLHHGKKGELMSSAASAVEETFRADIRQAFDLVEDGLSVPAPEKADERDEGVVLLKEVAAVEKALNQARTWDDYGIDIETNALRPLADGAKILTVAISNYEQTYAFAIDHSQAGWTASYRKRILAALRLLLLSGPKPIAHNSKFEQQWFTWLFGHEIIHEVDWQDTMAQAYVLDERKGAKSLEAVSMQTIGMNVKALCSVNVANLDAEPLDSVLRYNAYDAKYTYFVFHAQNQHLADRDLLEVYANVNRRAGPIVLAELLGVEIDSNEAQKLDARYSQELLEIEAKIQADKDVKAYVRKNAKFLSSSPKDVLGVLYHELGFKQCVVGENKYSTDEDVLSKIDHPLARLTLDLRGIAKLKSTYIEPLLPKGKHVWPDGKVHPEYSHLLTGTGRTSSSDPNIQNFPSRKDKEVRRVIVAPRGHWLVAFDWGQIEARVIAMASRDKVLTDALWEGYDIHGEWAEKIATKCPERIGGKKFLHDKDTMKKLRADVKNQWVFPLFYGSVLDSVANGLGLPASKLSSLFDDFWETFHGVAEWQQELRRFYRKHGYVETLTGFRRRAPLSFNELINSPIQGTASDIVVDAGNRLSKRAYEEERPQLQFRMNIHDDLSLYIPDDTLEQDIEDIGRETVFVNPAYSWISVPLISEVKAGRNWCDLDEICQFSSTDYGHKR